MEIFDDRPINPAQLPHDSAEMVEVLPGVLVPANRKHLFWDMVERSTEIKEAVDEILLERTSRDPLTDEPCVVVSFAYLSQLEAQLAQLLLEKSRANADQSRRVHSVASSLLNFGQ